MTVLAQPVLADTGLDAALDTIAVELERAHIRGLELAVVRDGSVVFSGGLGRRGVADESPVSGSTRFHHGSCGKAFTGLLAAALAEDGIVELDVPVRRWVPELRLPDPVIAERVTLRDLLSHRSGLGRHDLLWILDPSLGRDELVRRLEFLPLGGDLRNQWIYSNLAFTLAGIAMERATGATFERLVAERILGPLGMRRTTLSQHEVLADADHAHPHVVRDDAAIATQWRDDATIAPAGGVVSCADDSVRWLFTQLGDDSALSNAAVTTQRIVTPVPAGVSPFAELDFAGYGLGWVSGSYRDRAVVWHNGGVDGFGTQTLLLPRDRIGLVTCANVMDSSTTLAIALTVADALLGERCGQDWFTRVRSVDGDGAAATVPPSSSEPAPPARPLSAYAGTYSHPGYGDVTVAVAEDGLAVRLLATELGARHRHFETWDLHYEPLDMDLPLTFAAEPDGFVGEAVIAMDQAQPATRFARSRPEGC